MHATSVFNRSFLCIPVPTISCSQPVKLLLPIHSGSAPSTDSLTLGIHSEQGVRFTDEAAFCVEAKLENPSAPLDRQALLPLEACHSCSRSTPPSLRPSLVAHLLPPQAEGAGCHDFPLDRGPAAQLFSPSQLQSLGLLCSFHGNGSIALPVFPR